MRLRLLLARLLLPRGYRIVPAEQPTTSNACRECAGVGWRWRQRDDGAWTTEGCSVCKPDTGE